MRVSAELFKEIGKVTRAVIVKGMFWRQDNDGQLTLLQGLANALCDKLGLPSCHVSLDKDPGLYALTGGGRYDADTHTVYMYKDSLVTFLHCFSFHATMEGQWEVGPVEFSHRIFKLASPSMYKSAVERGMLFHAWEDGEEMVAPAVVQNDTGVNASRDA